MKLRIYLDTSVISAFYDGRAPDRQAVTQEFWARLEEFQAATSELTVDELRQCDDASLRAKFEERLSGLELLPVTLEMRELAQAYVQAGIFAPAMLNDGLHVAAAVFSRQDVLVSWNFRHLVNRRRRAQVNEMNVLRGLPTLEIVAPPEI